MQNDQKLDIAKLFHLAIYKHTRTRNINPKVNPKALIKQFPDNFVKVETIN